MVDFTAVNWVGVIVAAVVGLVIGFLWYAPQVFGRRWAAAAGIELLPPGRVPPVTIAIGVIALLITAYVLALLVRATGGTSVIDGAIIGFLGWLGFVGPWTLTWVAYERRPWNYFYVTAGQGLVSLVVMGAILGYFK